MKYSKMKDWIFLTGDIDWKEYGATWVKRDTNGVYWLLRFENKAEWGDRASGYYCQVLRINLTEIRKKEINSALSSCGYALENGNIKESYTGRTIATPTDEHFELVLVECLAGYGCYAPMGSEESRYSLRARARARRLADELMQDEVKQKKALNRPCNALGATARDFGKGDCLAPLRKKAKKLILGQNIELTDQENVLLKMYGASGGCTLGGTVETELALAGTLLDKIK